MQQAIQDFLLYMEQIRHAAANTMLSYERDLNKMCSFMEGLGIHKPDKVTLTALNSYILSLEINGLSTATISRTVATMRRFFDFQCKHGDCGQDPAELLKSPPVQKKKNRMLTPAELKSLLSQVGTEPKHLRDRAMVLAMSEGVRASEIIGLRVADLNLTLGYLTLRGERQDRTIPISQSLKDALRLYLDVGREILLGEKQSESLFLNCKGQKLSRQGVWKMVKAYGEMIEFPDLTPDHLRMSVEE